MSYEKKLGSHDQLVRRLEYETVDGQPAFAPTVISINRPHQEVHEGNTFQASTYTGTVANNDFVYFALSTTGTANGTHFSWEITAGGDAVVSLYEGFTGTLTNELSVFNLNRLSPNLSPNSAFEYPVISVYGTLLHTQLLSGGANNQFGGGIARRDTEWILAYGKVYLLATQNIAGTAQPISIVGQWYQL